MDLRSMRMCEAVGVGCHELRLSFGLGFRSIGLRQFVISVPSLKHSRIIPALFNRSRFFPSAEACGWSRCCAVSHDTQDFTGKIFIGPEFLAENGERIFMPS
jgi:hypothetical protein